MANDIDSQAIRWFVRLRAPDATDADRDQHAKWLAADVDHELAYAQVEQNWLDYDALGPWAREEIHRRGLTSRPTERWRAGIWVAGAVAASLALVVVWWGGPAPEPDDETLRIVTEQAEQRQMALDDGTRLHVNTASDLEVRYSENIREIVMNSGESLFDVDHEADRPFVVRAGRHSLIAVGTRFAVRRKHEGDWLVTVVEGRVAVMPGAPSNAEEFAALLSLAPSGNLEQGTILGANERLRITPAGRIVAEETDAEAATAWQSGMLKFRQTPLREAVKEISRYTVGAVRVADGVPDHPVTGVIHIRNRETMVDLLVEVVPVTAVHTGAGVTVLHAMPVEDS